MPEANARGASVAARLAHNLSHCMRIVVAHRLEAGDDAFAVGSVAVLARLPFSPYVEDLDLNADEQALVDGLSSLLSRYTRIETGKAEYLVQSPALERDLKDAGYFDVAREMGAVGAVLLIEAVARRGAPAGPASS